MTTGTVNPDPFIPLVTDADIDHVEKCLGVSFDRARREILCSNDSFDVQACPGSGKTTLLVGKLFILAERWPYPRRGICVLSHTNVARNEIESKLSGTAVGSQLLSYPHFVGTIQRFVNEFLALPLLRSEGFQVRMIDDEIHGRCCKRLMCTVPEYSKARFFLRKWEKNNPHRTIRALRYEGSDLRLGSAAGTFPCGLGSPSGRILAQIKEDTVKKGYWRFDDMFAWAERLLAKHSCVADFARWRFPAVFMDETQDTSELQARVLAAVFPSSGCSLRQRFGDSNQAIYDFGQKLATTDPFPARACRTVPNSQRFGPSVAIKAHPLAVDPPNPPLTGDGPRTNASLHGIDPATMPHTIFLFGPTSAGQVLPAFGRLLLQVFPDEVIQHPTFLARAIGRIGKSDSTSDTIPRHLGDYWAGYKPHVAKTTERPLYLADYIHAAQRKRAAHVDCSESVAMAARGICELVAMVRPDATSRVGYTVRSLRQELLYGKSSGVPLQHLLWEWCIEAKPILKERWIDTIQELRCALGPIIGSGWNPDADGFCQWSMEHAEQTPGPNAKGPESPNLYRYCQGPRYVDIDVGTIHSAKGQTHTSTLVVETHFMRYDMEKLVHWICGTCCGAASGKAGPEQSERMRLAYTAMTRPTHLLCLAMRREAIRRSGAEAETCQRLERLGWSIEDLGGCEGVP